MVAGVVTVAFEGVEARRVAVEVQIASGHVAFMVVGLGDKAVAENRERVRAAFAGLGLALPSKRLIVNLAPADLPKAGSHYDLPIALALMGCMGILPADALNGWLTFGELGLDGRRTPPGRSGRGAFRGPIAAGRAPAVEAIWPVERNAEPDEPLTINARLQGRALERAAIPDPAGQALLARAAEAQGLSARAWTRMLRLARTIADLDGSTAVRRGHIAEALIYRRAPLTADGAPPERRWTTGLERVP
jgi:magnesium chelatase family protein